MKKKLKVLLLILLIFAVAYPFMPSGRVRQKLARPFDKPRAIITYSDGKKIKQENFVYTVPSLKDTFQNHELGVLEFYSSNSDDDNKTARYIYKDGIIIAEENERGYFTEYEYYSDLPIVHKKYKYYIEGTGEIIEYKYDTTLETLVDGTIPPFKITAEDHYYKKDNGNVDLRSHIEYLYEGNKLIQRSYYSDDGIFGEYYEYKYDDHGRIAGYDHYRNVNFNNPRNEKFELYATAVYKYF